METLLDKCMNHDLLIHYSYSGAYAREWAEYKHALRRVEDLDPGLVGGPGICPLSELDEAAVALVNAAWCEGARVGAAFARAEDELNDPLRICDHCNGSGRSLRGPNAGESCLGCGGKGYVSAAGEWVAD